MDIRDPPWAQANFPPPKGPVPTAASGPPARGASMTRGAERSTCDTRGRQWTAYGGAITWRSPSRWPSGGGPRVPWSVGPRSLGMWAGSRHTGPSWKQRGHCPGTSSGAPPWASSLGRCEASYPPSAWQSVSAASPICSDFQTFCPDWLHFGHFLCFGGIAASQLSLRIFPIYF